MINTERCGVCAQSLRGTGMRLVTVAGRLWHAWCYLTHMAPSAPGRRTSN